MRWQPAVWPRFISDYHMRNWLLRNRAFLVYVPLIACTAARLLWRTDLRPGLLALLMLAGLLSWTFLEWALHRGMHVNTGVAVISRLQDAAHLRHHREPHDLEHSVVRLSASLPLSLLILSGLRLMLGDWNRALALLCGVLIGYLAYEYVHLNAHAGPGARSPRGNGFETGSHGFERRPGLRGRVRRRAWRPAPLRLSRRYHLRHHYDCMDRAFGVSTPLWDWVFGTLPARRESDASVEQS